MSEINTMNDVKIARLRVREIVTGKVVEVKENYILIDLNNFTEGTMYLDHYSLDKKLNSFEGLVNIGDEITCEITKIDEEHGMVLLSRLNTLRKESFEKLKDYVEDKTPIKVVVKKAINKGFLCNYQGFEFFLPESQAEGAKIGDTLEVRILEIDDRKRSGVVSRRVIEREAYQDAKAKEFDKISVGDVLTGTVNQIESFGAFIKFEYNQGLLRLNQLSHIFVKNINDVLHVGDKIEVKVTKKENNRLELSHKALLKTPYEEYELGHKVGETVKAKVAQKLPFGVILELNPHVRGLLHVSEFSWNPNDNLMASLKFGDELEVAILSMDSKKEKVSLSRKALIDNPWSRVKAKEGDEIEALITGINAKGITFEALGVDGFIPGSELVFEGNSSKIEDYYAKGDKIKSIIIELNPREWKLVASVKKLKNKLERQNFEKYMENQNDTDVNQTLGDLFKDVLK